MLLTSCLYNIDKGSGYPGWQALIPITGACLIIISSSKSIVNKYILGSKPLVFIGLISYPLYLWHWPILSFIRIITEEGRLSKELQISGILLSILLSILTWKFVESPLRFNKKKESFYGLLIIMTLTSSLGFSVYKNKGIENRFPAEENNAKQFSLMSQGDLEGMKKVDCNIFSLENKNLGCYISNPNKKPTVIAIGDSHAVHNTTGFVEYFNRKGENMAIIYQGGCLPYIDTQVFRSEIESCSISMKQTLEFIMASPDIKTVFLANRGSWYLNGRELNSNLKKFEIGLIDNPTEKDRTKIFYTGLSNTINMLTEKNKNIIFVIDNPELLFNPKNCSKSRPFYINQSYNEKCSQSIEVTKDYDKDYNTIINKLRIEYKTVNFFDIRKYLCDTEHCYAKIDGSILYSDRNHLSPAGSKFVANFLEDVMK